MRKALTTVIAMAGVSAGVLAFDADARACGGCFHPPPGPQEDPGMVTSHRMILSVSPKQTTLYDQIKYSGNPKDFAWVLPINGLAEVGLSADVVFTTLGSLTQVSINPPPMNCPQPPSGCEQAYEDNGAPTAGGGSSGSSGALGADAGVVVVKEETVGPYETVQLKSTDPQALNTWLTDHNYTIPDDVKPIIAAYVNEHYDFLALKLVPGANVTSMRPVRVTTPGGSPVLPLRMVAAGTGATVGITLWVLGDGRYETQNFPNFLVKGEDLTWDWTTYASDFTKVRLDKENALAGKGWETEVSLDLPPSQISQIIRGGSQGTGNIDYLGSDGGPDGSAGESPDQAREDDITTLFGGLTNPTVRVTRLRSDLAHAALATDLVLQAAGDQSIVPNLRRVTKEANEPTCPIYQGCAVVGEGPRSEAQAAAAKSSSAESFSCSATRTRRASSVAFFAVGGAALLFGLRVRRSKRNRGS